MSISAKINTSSTIKGSVSQGNQPQVTRVTVPGPKGDTGASGNDGIDGSAQNQVSNAVDVDTSTFGLADGSVLQWRTATQKWTARTELDTTTGNLVLSGGSF